MNVKGFQDTIEWYNQNADQYAKATFQTASPEEIDQFAKAFKMSVESLKEAIKRDGNLADRIADRYSDSYQRNLHFRVTPITTSVSTASIAPPTNLTTTTMPPPPKPPKP